MEKSVRIPKVKICGITSRMEAEYLNAAKADYAGFVFYEKSRRNVSFGQAANLMEALSKDILKVAVMVSPSLEFIREAEKQKFDLLQIHGTFDQNIRNQVRLPVWRAVNISDARKLEEFFVREAEDGMEQIEGYVADGAGYGGGKPFDWENLGKKVREFLGKKKLILAGGLTEENVRQGISCFAPDVVDVSSGVEENGKKSREKINNFIRKVKEHG